MVLEETDEPVKEYVLASNLARTCMGLAALFTVV